MQIMTSVPTGKDQSQNPIFSNSCILFFIPRFHQHYYDSVSFFLYNEVMNKIVVGIGVFSSLLK